MRLSVASSVAVALGIVWSAAIIPSLAVASTSVPTPLAIERASQDARLDPRLAHFLLGKSDGQALFRETRTLTDRVPLLLQGELRDEDLATLGVEVRTHAGPVRTVLAPAASIPALLELAGIERVEAPHQLQPLLNISSSDVGAPTMWGSPTPPYPLSGTTGKGIYIGIIDTGLDLGHADFRTSTNQTRVKYLWDQTVGGLGPPGSGFTYGTEYTESQINAGMAPEVDTNGHGTHMAGIAAGNGRATGNGYSAYRYTGIAPEARLIIVKSHLDDLDVIDALKYIFQRADTTDCVVLIAAGDSRGAHDGTSSLDVAVSSLTGPGKIVVAPAGNQGGQPLHGQTTVGSGQSASFTISVPSYSASVQNIDVEGWHGSAASFSAKVTSPNGYTSPWTAPGTATGLVLTSDGGISVTNAMVVNSKGSKQIRVYLSTGTSRIASGVWRIDLQRQASATDGKIDLWLADWYLPVAPALTSLVSNSALVQSPSTGDSVISVGAFVTKTRWEKEGGGSSSYADDPPMNNLAPFSSPGPRRDGLQRPDIMAPGEGVAAARSSSAPIFSLYVVEDGAHWMYRGTSAAAAHVAGAVALLLERARNMTPTAVRLALADQALSDSYTGTVPNASWGYGKLHIGTVTTGVEDATAWDLAFYRATPNPARGAVNFDFVLSAKDLVPEGGRVRLSILDVNGRHITTIPGQDVAGRQQLVWNGLTPDKQPAPPGMYLARLEVGTHRALCRFVVLR